jgi:periplasmic protein CpxP/Spy
MKIPGFRCKRAGTRRIVVALIAICAFATGSAFAAGKDAHGERAELRIKDMHTKLKINAAQETQWAKVAEAMRENAQTMDALTAARIKREKDMTAVDDLNSYAKIADAHSEGIKNLLPSFTVLYTSMSEAQKNQADTLFRRGEHDHHHDKAAKK